MSDQVPDAVGKKAIHVKWAGRTIALGTFPLAEAEEKSARAKALTRAWRSTMQPKPSREWVILELERLGVRVVSGSRAGKTMNKQAESGDDEGTHAYKSPTMNFGVKNEQDFDTMMQRRSSSIGYAMMDGDLRRRSDSFGLGQVGRNEDVVMPPHRPLVGGASAAAYEAARADHYNSLAAKKRLSGDTPRRPSLGGGRDYLGGGAPSFSASSNQHYEMLKLHHMNLLNEIQETTLMMNLYQQQQLQQQRQQLQEQERMMERQGPNHAPSMKMSQQQSARNPDAGSSYGGGIYGDRSRGGTGGMMETMGRSPSLGFGSMEGMNRGSLGLGTMDSMNRGSLGLGTMEGRASLGLGSWDRSIEGVGRFSLGLGGSGGSLGKGANGLGGSGSSLLAPSGANEQDQGSKTKRSTNEGRPGRDTRKIQEELLAQVEEQRILEERLQKVRKEIAQRQREAEALEASFGVSVNGVEKRTSSGSDDPADDDTSSRKKRKSDDTSGVTSCEV